MIVFKKNENDPSLYTGGGAKGAPWISKVYACFHSKCRLHFVREEGRGEKGKVGIERGKRKEEGRENGREGDGKRKIGRGRDVKGEEKD